MHNLHAFGIAAIVLSAAGVTPAADAISGPVIALPGKPQHPAVVDAIELLMNAAKNVPAKARQP
jgi:hypothetical protein